MAAAARSRADTALALVSPTASTIAPGLPNTYSLNEPDEQGMAALARHAASTGVTRLALLYPRAAEYAEKARAFAAALRAAGGTVVADVPYDSGTTTFRAQLRRVSDAAPQGLAVFAPERDVRQLAPQISYYGVSARGVRIFGGENWTSDEILRLVEPRYTNGVVASTPLVKESSAAGWQEVTHLYETTYKRTLDTPFPALGYDAARLILWALPRGRVPRPAEVSCKLGTLRGFRAATGVLSVRQGSLVREPFLVRIEEGKLVPLVTPASASGNGGAGGAR
ncbi:MAG TPA: ABC transporter substrate-binding protein [Longimicrobiales bacterium]